MLGIHLGLGIEAAINNNIKFPLYRVYSRYKIKRIRKKKEITVLFVLAELGAWKTELLYKRMLKHDRFKPILGVTTSQEVPGSKEPLVAYLKSKNYDFIDLDRDRHGISNIAHDIKLYYKPYSGSYPNGIYFDAHLRSLVCNVSYAFNVGGDYQSYNRDLLRVSTLNFIENKTVLETIKSIPKISHNNNVITGVPMQDALLVDKSLCCNPWKDCGDKKKIIYAPHHSLPGTNGTYIEYSTFLEFGEFMLEMAKKYKDKVQWTFKPHPTLYPKLVKIWGKEKTDTYYNQWRVMANTQVELGEYVGLFKHSDAMIHDCSSFTIEYLFTQNPVMFLQTDYSQTDIHQGKFGHEAYLAHYIGNTTEDIESFINHVISGQDSMKEKRQQYMNEYLLPPNGQSACDNILDAILGQGAYKYIGM